MKSSMRRFADSHPDSSPLLLLLLPVVFAPYEEQREVEPGKID
jgi:hypothetical protein